MTQLQSKSQLVGMDSLGEQARMREARPIRRKRQIISTFLIVIVILGAFILYGITETPHVAKVISSATLDASRTQATAVPNNPKSEVITTTLDDEGNGGSFGGQSRMEEAITLTAATPSVSILAQQGSAFACSNGQSPCEAFVDGVSYQRDPTTGRWTARRYPHDSAVNRSPNNPNNNIATFRKISLGPVVNIGHATIGGIPTTEYRATISLIDLYGSAQMPQGSLVGAVRVNRFETVSSLN